MKTLSIAAGALAAAIPLALSATPASAQTLRISGVAARIVVTPENRSDIIAEVSTGRGVDTPRIQRSGAGLSVLGDYSDSDLRNCRKRDGRSGDTLVLRRRNVSESDLPVVRVRAPRDVRIVADGALIGSIGPSESLSLTSKRCATWTIGAVSGRMNVAHEGVGDVRAGSADATSVRLEGLGDFRMGATRSFTAALEGMGDVDVARVDGPVDVSLDGMGDVSIAGGRATTFRARVDGMGDVRFNGTADTLDATANGMGEVWVAHVTGTVKRNQSGFAKVRVGGR
jgi:hypothetical protein